MKFYCGIDLSARDCHLCVMDEQLKIMVQQTPYLFLTRFTTCLIASMTSSG